MPGRDVRREADNSRRTVSLRVEDPRTVPRTPIPDTGVTTCSFATKLADAQLRRGGSRCQRQRTIARARTTATSDQSSATNAHVVAHLFDADVLAGEHDAHVDLLAVVTDATAAFWPANTMLTLIFLRL